MPTPGGPILTPLQAHKQKWKDGCGSDQCCNARRRVFCRGDIPAHVLFIAEAPGESEDSLGVPLIGPAGKLLDEIIADSLNGRELSIAFTNVVGCIPKNEVGGEKAIEPTKAQIVQCRPRLVEFVRIVKPLMIVLVGKVSAKHVYGASMFRLDKKDEQPEWIPNGGYLELVEITHPAAILRSPRAETGLLIQRCTATLSAAFEDLKLFP
jgi:uracil-DNA glycosylase family 4